MTTSVIGSVADFESGAERVARPRPTLPAGLTLKLPASTFANTDSSPCNDDLLTPPLTNPSRDESPFRPSESDRMSLSMKRRHGSSSHRRRRRNRACVSSGDVDQTVAFSNEFSSKVRTMSRSQSAPNLTKSLRAAFKRQSTKERSTFPLAKNLQEEAEFASRRGSLPKLPRRWTVAGKAAPTHVLTSTSPSAVIAASIQPVGHNEGRSVEDAVAVVVDTPAMITLQRAASRCQSRRTSLRPEAYVSFPTPRFNKTRSGLVTTFFGDSWQRWDHTFIHASVESVSVTSHGHPSLLCSDRASVDRGVVQPSLVTSAETVCTDVVLDPIVLGHSAGSGNQIRARRCSTKHTSSAITHEVIWDENISTTNSSGTSHKQSPEQSRRISIRDLENGPERRHSMAVDKLEAQHYRGIQQSRKGSVVSKGADVGKTTPSARRSADPVSSHNPFNFRLPGFSSDEEPQKAQAGTIIKQKLLDLGSRIDFVPPALTRTSLDDSNDSLLTNPWRTSWDASDAPDAFNGKKSADPESVLVQQRKGGMLGQTAGVRKKSVQKNWAKLEQGIAMTRKRKSKDVEDDQEPLLGNFNP